MTLDLHRPIIHLITSGRTTAKTTRNDPEYSTILRLVEAAVTAQIELIQIREKNLSVRILFELSREAASITSGTTTRLLLNERFDVALAAHADGVQLPSKAIDANPARAVCGPEFLIGVSTHSLDEARRAKQGADFVVFGPVFDTPTKRAFGKPQGVQRLTTIVHDLGSFPVIAIGGVSLDNVKDCLVAGVAGVAGISLFSDEQALTRVVSEIRATWVKYRRE